MRGICRRVEKLEKKLNVNTDRKLVRIIIRRTCEKGTAPVIPQPVEEWLTYKEALEKALVKLTETGRGSLRFIVDPFKEYEVRNGLREGTLSKHELKEKIPFDELLAEVETEAAAKKDKSNEGK